MSEQYPGGFITKTPPTPDGTTARGMWTLSQAAGYQKQGLWPVPYIPQYIEDVFSTWLYTGASGAQSINNGIDLAGEGGLLWLKDRTNAGTYHYLEDSARGAAYSLNTNTTGAQQYYPNYVTSFNSNGFTIGAGQDNVGAAYVSWTFRKQPKFFDVVTYTGTGTGTRTLNHNLGSAPGFFVIKRTDSTGTWFCYHNSLGVSQYLALENTNAAAAFTNCWQTPTSTTFGFGTSSFNINGATYVAYLFAHDSGGFGLTGTDNVISCGSFTGSGAGVATTVTLGYEPQFIIAKRTDAAQNWIMFDNMRGFDNTNAARLFPNLSNAESTVPAENYFTPTATGFKYGPGNSMGDTANIIYIAIRRGPMKVPTSGTSVFVPVTSSATGSVLTSNFPVDMGLIAGRGVYERGINDRLRGFAGADSGSWPWLVTQTAAAEASQTPSLYNANNTSIQTGAYFGSASAVSYLFGRAPGFFDEVCYTGTGSTQTVAHNLTVAPELMIVKSRSAVVNWKVYQKDLGTLYGGGNPAWQYNLTLNSTASTDFSASRWSQDPTSTVFGVATNADTNGSGSTYVAYLFASAPGVSKVGSYTGTGALQTVNCGFAAGARFVLIKRTDSTGDWYVWDSARGIVAGNDPYLLLNSTAAEVTSTDYVDTYSAGFEISSTAPAAINASGGSFIFLAIA
jgi:hypothetical protein